MRIYSSQRYLTSGHLDTETAPLKPVEKKHGKPLWYCVNECFTFEFFIINVIMNKSHFFSYSLSFMGFFLLVFFFNSCKKDNNEEPPIVTPLNDNSLPSAAILNIKVIEKSNDRLRFQMDLAVFRDSKNVEDNLDGSNFLIDTLILSGSTTRFNNDRTQLINASNATDYAALMLLDQSGSISSTDPENYRLEAAKIFCSNLGANNNIGLWSFANSNYTKLVDFTTDTALVTQEIEKLRNHEGGSTPLYKSQYEAISYTKDNATKTNKAVLTFTDGEDTDYGKTSDEVVAHANDKSVRLYNIGLEDVNTRLLLKQAVATNGAFLYAKDARQLISIFGNLGKLLTNTAIYYQTEWTISGQDANNLFQGSGSIEHELKITFPYGGEISVPFSFDYD